MRMNFFIRGPRQPWRRFSVHLQNAGRVELVARFWRYQNAKTLRDRLNWVALATRD